MLNWQKWQGTPAEWNTLLQGFPDYTIYQCYQWGEHRSRFGWTPHRLVAIKDGMVAAIAQALVRRFPFGIALAWVPGGPLGQTDSWDSRFRAALKSSVGAFGMYYRLNPMCNKTYSDVELIRRCGWSLTKAPLNSGMSMCFSLSADEDTRMGNASKNWRHNLRRSQKYGHSVIEWQDPDPDDMLSVYDAMQAHKQLDEQISKPALVSMLETFGDRCLVVKCCDQQGNILALRGALLLGHKAWDIFAAATPEGRKVYASHAAFWELTRLCASRGIDWYDMSGIDPVGNKGVYDFKKGTGASEVNHLGEWDFADIPMLSMAANYMIRKRARSM